MAIKCNCADPLEKSNADALLKRVDDIIKETETSSLRFREPETIEASLEFWRNTKNMLNTITKLPDC